MIGILKAGGVYVPLAPDLPESRFLFCLNNCESRLLLIENDLLHDFAVPDSILVKSRKKNFLINDKVILTQKSIK